jgi:DNA-binding NarL/FixJ family response regulator
MRDEYDHGRLLRIGVVDNDLLALEGIVALLQRLTLRDGWQIDIWSTDNPAQAIQECRFGKRHTDIIFIDMALNGLTGAQVAAEIRKHVEDIGIIGITSYEPQSYVSAMLSVGAQALLDKTTLKQTLPDALEAVSQGLPYPSDSGFLPVSRAYEARIFSEDTVLNEKLTGTELSIIILSLRQLNTEEIAKRLGTTKSTVFSHRRNIKNKLHADTWNGALENCRRLHII